MAKHLDETVSVVTRASEHTASRVPPFIDCNGVSRTGQTVCTIVHNGNDTHGGFSNVTDQFRTWGKHRA